ncbi:MAG: nitroreductase family protein [Clostridia bacterium]|nr:nitroreductase family protein [Clostridia bacterium]
MKSNTIPDISIDQDKCSCCGTCVNVCSEGIFKFEGKRVKAVFAEKCEVCGHCIAGCKFDAIQHSLLPLMECPQIAEQDQPKLEQMIALFRARRSVRNYLSKHVDRRIIQELISISRWVPSSQNKQSVDWLVLDKKEEIEYFSRKTAEVLFELGKIIQKPIFKPFIRAALGSKKFKEAQQSAKGFSRVYERFKNGEDPVFYNAPAVIVAYTPAGSYFGRDDSLYALYNLILAAHKVGLGSCQIGYFIVALENNTGMRKELGLPDGYRPQAAITLGYPKRSFYRGVSRRMPDIRWGTAKTI